MSNQKLTDYRIEQFEEFFDTHSKTIIGDNKHTKNNPNGFVPVIAYFTEDSTINVMTKEVCIDKFNVLSTALVRNVIDGPMTEIGLMIIGEQQTPEQMEDLINLISFLTKQDTIRAICLFFEDSEQIPSVLHHLMNDKNIDTDAFVDLSHTYILIDDECDENCHEACECCNRDDEDCQQLSEERVDMHKIMHEHEKANLCEIIDQCRSISDIKKVLKDIVNNL